MLSFMLNEEEEKERLRLLKEGQRDLLMKKDPQKWEELQTLYARHEKAEIASAIIRKVSRSFILEYPEQGESLGIGYTWILPDSYTKRWESS